MALFFELKRFFEQGKSVKIKKGFVLREVCGEQVIMGEGLEAIDFGHLLCLNSTAAWLWKQAENSGDFSIDSLSEKLCEEYEVTREQAKKDVSAIINQWQKVKVIE